MAKQRSTTEEIIHKLREADALIGQGKTTSDACPGFALMTDICEPIAA